VVVITTMSGRVKVTLPSGRRVTGYRKTERTIEHRSKPRERPMLRIAFQAPARLLLTPTAVSGVIGVSVKDPGPMVEVLGTDRGWLFKQLRAFLDKVEAPRFNCIATATRSDRATAVSHVLEYHPYKPMTWNGRPVE
jgi:hypothetical protein